MQKSLNRQIKNRLRAFEKRKVEFLGRGKNGHAAKTVRSAAEDGTSAARRDFRRAWVRIFVRGEVLRREARPRGGQSRNRKELKMILTRWVFGCLIPNQQGASKQKRFSSSAAPADRMERGRLSDGTHGNHERQHVHVHANAYIPDVSDSPAYRLGCRARKARLTGLWRIKSVHVRDCRTMCGRPRFFVLTPRAAANAAPAVKNRKRRH